MDEDDELERAYREFDQAGGGLRSPLERLVINLGGAAGVALFFWAIWYFDVQHHVTAFVDWLFGW